MDTCATGTPTLLHVTFMTTPIDGFMKVTLATALGPRSKLCTSNPWAGIEYSSLAPAGLQVAIVVPPRDDSHLPGPGVTGGVA